MTRPPVVAGSSLLNSLAAYYQLEEASGARADSSGNGLALSATNTPGNAAGIQGNALALVAASSQFVSRVNDASLQMSGDFTIAVWVYPLAINVLGMFCTKGSGFAATNTEYRMFQNNADLNIQVGDGTNVKQITMASVFTANAWHLVVFRYKAGTPDIRARVDNGADTVVSMGGVAVTTTADFRLGEDMAGGGLYWNGRIDEAGVWDAYLSDTQVSNLYNSGAGVTYPFTGVP